MAGIGFRIRKLVGDDSYIASLKANFYSAIICSGPWILSIITIFSLTLLAPPSIGNFEMLYFRSAITYVFAFSLIFSGIFYLSLSRYLSDKLYLKRKDAIVPAYNTATLFFLSVQLITGYLIFWTAGIAITVRILAILVYMVISMIWVIMIFLTSMRDYQAIVKAYVIGTVVTVIGAVFLGEKMGVVGYFLGYFIGHFMIFIILSGRIFIEFDSKNYFDKELFIFLYRNKSLVLIGVFYNLAIWIDKIVFWYSPRAINIAGAINAFPEYEIPVFFAYLTIIPALGLFLIHIETDFYEKYKRFYSRVLNKGTYPMISEAKEAMAESLKKSITKLIVIQGLITIFSIVFAPQIISITGMGVFMAPIFRIATLGAFLHSMLLIAIIITLYFDFKDVALLISAIFFFSNWIFTYMTTNMDTPFLGYGYFFSVFLTLIVAFFMLSYRFKRLEYYTFAKQPF